MSGATRPVRDVVLYDGQHLYTLTHANAGALHEWIVAMSTPQLEGIAAQGATTFENVNPRRALKIVDAELATRVGRRPSRERAVETGAEVHMRRRWHNLTPVLTNYTNGDL
jgi:hypothetical protein